MFAAYSILAAATAMMSPAPTAKPTPGVVASTILAADADTSTTQGVSPADSLSQRYCIVGEVIGSRIPRKDCATLGEWQVQGVDPRKMRRL